MKGLEKTLSDWFQMTDEVWARHANPWSVITRYSCLPLFALAVWSRTWMGVWALAPTAIVVLWTWFNPRVFSKPSSTDNWASKAVLGERVWLNRKEHPVPAHHGRIVPWLNVIAGGGFLYCIWGLVVLDATGVVVGLFATIVGKSWFLDRMVWVYQDMAGDVAEYRDWLY